MKKTFLLQYALITILGFSLLFLVGCEDDNGTEVEEPEIFDDIDVTLVNNWDLYEISYDSLQARSLPSKFKFDLGRDGEGYPVLVEEYYLSITTEQIDLGGEVFSSDPEEIETLHLNDHQLFTVSTEQDTVYYYDYYRNTDNGALWMREDTTPDNYFAVDPTITDSVGVVTGNDTVYYAIDIDEYMLFFVHGQGPLLELEEPENNTQIDDLTPTFSWEDNDADEYLFQVRNDTMFNSDQGFIYNEIITTNSFTVPDSEPLENFNSFYWRVKADNSDWSNIWNFGTYNVVQLNSPLNTQRVCRKPTLDWEAYPGATEYTLNIAKDANFTEELMEINTAATEYVHNDYFEDGVNYFWRVKAINSEGYWSETRYFKIRKSVAISTPEDDATEIGIPVTFTWEELQNATDYTIQVASDSTFDTIVLEEDVTDNTFTEGGELQVNQEYYWRVNSDVATAWGDFGSFMTNNIVLLESPENGAEYLGVIIEFSWAEYAGAEIYALQVAEDDAFTNITVNADSIEENSYIPEVDLQANMDYYWRVQHNTSDWSEIWSFSTNTLSTYDDEPVFPIEGSSGVHQLPTLDWETISNSSFYRVQLAEDVNFTNMIVNHVGTGNTYELNEDDGETLLLNTTYYWKVRSDISNWSDTWSFTTKTGIPYDVEAVVQDETPNKIDVTWFCSSGLQTAYIVERSSDGGATWETLANVDILNEYYCDLGLDANMTYNYRISTENPTGNSAPSECDQATTGSFALGNNEPEMVSVPSGTFTMGCLDGDPDEEPVRDVTLTNNFSVGKYEITNQEYCTLLNWAFGKGLIKGVLYDNLNYNANALNYSEILQDPEDSDLEIEYRENEYKFVVNSGMEDHPITSVTWFGAAAYTNWLSHVKNITELYDNTWNCTTYGSNGYRLLTEAEWEYCAKEAGSGNNYTYSGSNTVDEVAWYFGNATQIMTVGQKNANGIDTYDMSGNLWEWCNDYYGDYDPAQTTDPTGPNSGTHRILRGGSWEFEAYYLRNSNRSRCKPDLTYGRVNTSIGFRIMMVP